MCKYIMKMNSIEYDGYNYKSGVTTIKNGVLDLKQFDSLFRNWKEIDNHIYIEKMSKVEDENKIVLGLGSWYDNKSNRWYGVWFRYW